MNIHKIHDLSNSFVTNLLEEGLSNVDKGWENYSPKYADKNSNLFYILDKGRYKKGAYYVLEEDGKYIGSSGWNEYEYETTVSLVLTRSYIIPEKRANYYMAAFLLPSMLEECNNYEKIWITCNKNNDTIYKWFVRNAEGKPPAIFNNWPDIYKRFEPIGLKTVYYTEQYVAQLKR
jgi:predicted secreted protein